MATGRGGATGTPPPHPSVSADDERGVIMLLPEISALEGEHVSEDVTIRQSSEESGDMCAPITLARGRLDPLIGREGLRRRIETDL